MEESSLAVNIAQLIPTHLRPEFAATVNCKQHTS
jgi:hypothetical protein